MLQYTHEIFWNWKQKIEKFEIFVGNFQTKRWLTWPEQQKNIRPDPGQKILVQAYHLASCSLNGRLFDFGKHPSHKVTFNTGIAL